MQKEDFFQGKIIHLLPMAAWEKALNDGKYKPASLKKEGFIHFSTREHALETADLYYATEASLVALVVVAKWVKKDLRWEPGRDGIDFPHLYGDLDLEQVETTVHLAKDATGKFVWE